MENNGILESNIKSKNASTEIVIQTTEDETLKVRLNKNRFSSK